MLDEDPEEIISLSLGNKLYEMSNHLGNVLTVINDIKVPLSSNSVDVDGYLATIVSTADYSPFGVQLDERTESAETYRYGYQGSEKDDEVKGSGNSYTTEFRLLDPRLGRWLSIDPLAAQFPWQSPYVSMDNNPIWLNDVAGDSTDNPTSKNQIDSFNSNSSLAGDIPKPEKVTTRGRYSDPTGNPVTRGNTGTISKNVVNLQNYNDSQTAANRRINRAQRGLFFRALHVSGSSDRELTFKTSGLRRGDNVTVTYQTPDGPDVAVDMTINSLKDRFFARKLTIYTSSGATRGKLASQSATLSVTRGAGNQNEVTITASEKESTYLQSRKTFRPNPKGRRKLKNG